MRKTNRTIGSLFDSSNTVKNISTSLVRSTSCTNNRIFIEESVELKSEIYYKPKYSTRTLIQVEKIPKTYRSN